MKIAGPKYKVCRRLGAGVFDQCQTQQYVLSEARHGKNMKRGRRPSALSDYGKQLLEKQKVRTAYGVGERQLRRYISIAKKGAQSSDVDPATNLAQILEGRIDNIVYRAGLAPTRRAARQLVSHGHILVNGARTTIPSHELREGDTFSVRPQSTEKPVFALRKEEIAQAKSPSWLQFDAKKLEGKVSARPKIELTELVGDFGAILEFYSR